MRKLHSEGDKKERVASKASRDRTPFSAVRGDSNFSEEKEGAFLWAEKRISLPDVNLSFACRYTSYRYAYYELIFALACDRTY